MNHSTGKQTAEQSRRHDLIKDVSEGGKGGCIYCRLWQRMHGRPEFAVMCEIHHFKRGNIRIGHHATVGACQWHHRAVPFGDYMNHAACRLHLGPSLAEGGTIFNDTFGSDAKVLVKQNAQIGVSDNYAVVDKKRKSHSSKKIVKRAA